MRNKLHGTNLPGKTGRRERPGILNNTALILGVLILLCIVVVMVWPELLAGRSPYDRQRVRFSIVEGKLEIDAAPFPPSRDFPLGSDDFGRDILSYIAYGTRLTMLMGLLIAAGRFLLATPAALAAGSGNVVIRGLLKQGNVLFSAIPALLISVILLRLDYFGSLDKGASMLAFVILLSVVGTPKLGSLLTERVDAVYQQPFIRGEVAIGKHRLRILRENVLPHLVPELTVLFFMEIARALTMLMQLGVFSVFIGNLKVIADTEGGVSFFNISFEPEWSSMLATSRSLINVAPWAVIFPALAFFVSVLGFNLFGEGLRNAMQRPDARVIPRIRKLLMVDWRALLNPLKRAAAGHHRKKMLPALLTMAVLTALVAVPALMNGKQSFRPYSGPPLPSGPVVLGTPAAEAVAERIAGEMEVLGIDPLYDEEYLNPYTVSPACLVQEQQVTLSIAGTDPQELVLQRDFAFAAAGDLEREGTIYDATDVDILSYAGRTFLSTLAGRFIMLDKQFYSDATLHWCMDAIIGSSGSGRETGRTPAGFLLVARDGDDEYFDRSMVPYSDDYPAITVSRELADTIRGSQNGTARLSVATKVQPLGTTGWNIGGIYRGTDQFIGDEAVIISLPYNYLESERREVLAFGLALMSNLCAGREHERSIIFLFSDGSFEAEYHGIVPTAIHFPYEEMKVQVSIDLSGLSRSRFDELVFSNAQAPFTRQFAWSLARSIGENLERRGITLLPPPTMFVGNEYYFTGDVSDNAMFWEAGIATILIGHPRQAVPGNTVQNSSGRYSLEELGRVVMKHMESINY